MPDRHPLMKPNLKKQRQELITRLADAMREHRTNPPPITDRKYIERLALRYGVNKRTMEIAIDMNAQGACQ